MASTPAHLTETQIRSVAADMFEAWNRHDIESILVHLSPDVVWTDPALPEPVRGKPAVTKALKDNFKAFPDIHLPTEDFEVFPDAKSQSLAVAWSLVGTMTGPLENGVPPTGKTARIRGVSLIRIRDGMITEYSLHYDLLDLMQQLGMLPRTNGLGFKALVMADVMAGKAIKVLQRH